ncbi:MAG: exo-beta-N-acetylmuramidase NamZ domain-containing protein, partial [Myxococcales bacterium]
MLGVDELLRAVDGLRVGAILNPTSVSEDLTHLADVLHGRGVLAALFGPEHGVRGDVQYLEEVGDA